MANDVLNSLLKEYEQKKMREEIAADNRKEELYTKIPRLKKLDNEINSYAISVTKNILNSKSYSLSSLSDRINSLKKEKELILKENHIDFDYLKPHYECSLCHDTGYIQKDNYQTEMCSCLKQKLLDASFNKSNMYNIKTENFNSFNEKLYSDVVNIERYKFKESPRQNILNIKNRCEDFIRNFDDINNKNLLFTGSTGLR